MALDYVTRARVTMARIKDDTSPADSEIAAATALKYADAFITVYRPNLVLGDLTNEEKATVYVNVLRDFHKQVLVSSRVPAEAETARASELSDVETEVDSELGTKETEPE